MAAVKKRALVALLASAALTRALPPAPARAADPAVAEAQRAQIEALRGQVASQIQLQAYDLLDELVFGWNQQPVFATDTGLVLADVSVPVGLGTGLQALIENHMVGLLANNPRTHVFLVHCPACLSLVVHSGVKGTVISRGVDEPEAMQKARTLSTSRHALFLDFEAEGAALVLRTRITSLEPALPIVYAKTLSTTTASPALLRSGAHLKSAAGARQEYLEALEQRGAYLVPIRMGVRTYAVGRERIALPPFAWLQAGVEASLSQAQAWTGSLTLGLSWAPELHVGWFTQARIGRLLTGSVKSLTHPDLYAFLGGAVFSIHGQSALLFRDEVPTADTLIAQALGREPSTAFGAFQLGVELRVKNRIGVAAFLESLPTMSNAPAIGVYQNLGIVAFRSLGLEVSFCF
jgi:hypothetical protein